MAATRRAARARVQTAVDVAAVRQAERIMLTALAEERRAVAAADTLGEALDAVTVDRWHRALLRVWATLGWVWDGTADELGVELPPMAARMTAPTGLLLERARSIVVDHRAALREQAAQPTLKGLMAGLARLTYRRLRGRVTGRAAEQALQAVAAVQHAAAVTAEQLTRRVVLRVWRTQLDDRVRDWHRAAEGQRRHLDEPFDVGGEQLTHPRDPYGSPANVRNCRCYVEQEWQD